VKVFEKDGDDNILDQYEVGCWDILTNIFAESVFNITERFVESMNSDNSEFKEEIIEKLLEIQTLKI
jgi:hypothetical protein